MVKSSSEMMTDDVITSCVIDYFISALSSFMVEVPE